MGHALVMIAILLIAAVSFVAPWMGVIAAYIVSVMAPQYIWWWDFNGLRPSLYVMVPVLFGFVIAVLLGKAKLRELNTPVNKMVALLWIFFAVSFFFGPYVHVVNRWRFYNPEVVFETTSKALLTYFVAAVLLDSTKKIRYGALVMIITFVYMTYWANAQYYVHHIYGRLHGPESLYGGIYDDQNDFAVLFVTGAPFLYFLSQQSKRKMTMVIGILIVLLSWNAIFLTASRGALIGLLSIILLFALRTKKKYVAVMVVAALALAYWREGGALMKERAGTITNYSANQSAEERLEAWRAAIHMMEAHPLVGVGYASFGQAYPSYSSTHPRIAHDTFFQIGGECGVLAGVLYLILMAATLNNLRKNGNILRPAIEDREIRFYYLLNEACLYSLTGFFACAMFLSLQTYEVWYYLLLMANAVLRRSDELMPAVGRQPRALNGRGTEEQLDPA